MLDNVSDLRVGDKVIVEGYPYENKIWIPINRDVIKWRINCGPLVSIS